MRNNGRSIETEVKMLKRVTVMLAESHRESQRRFAENERILAELIDQGRDLKQQTADLKQQTADIRGELVELKKITTIHSKAILKLLPRNTQ